MIVRDELFRDLQKPSPSSHQVTESSVLLIPHGVEQDKSRVLHAVYSLALLVLFGIEVLLLLLFLLIILILYL